MYADQGRLPAHVRDNFGVEAALKAIAVDVARAMTSTIFSGAALVAS